MSNKKTTHSSKKPKRSKSTPATLTSKKSTSRRSKKPVVSPRRKSRTESHAEQLRVLCERPDLCDTGFPYSAAELYQEIALRAEYITSGRVKKLRSNFSDQEAIKQLLCSSCNKIFDLPRVLPCKHYACEECVEELCDVCSKPSKGHKSASNIVDQLNELELQCNLAGCSWTGKYKDLIVHVNEECRNAPIQCDNCDAKLLRFMEHNHREFCVNSTKKDSSSSSNKLPKGSSSEDVVIERPQTSIDELQSKLEEAVLRLHVLQRQEASVKNAMLDTDMTAEQMDELEGVSGELTKEISKQEADISRIESKLHKKTGERQTSTIRVVEKGIGDYEVNEAPLVELDSEDSGDNSRNASLYRSRSYDAVNTSRTLDNSTTSSGLSASSSSAVNKSSIARRKAMQHAQSQAYDRSGGGGMTRLPPQPVMPGRDRPTSQAPNPPKLKKRKSKRSQSPDVTKQAKKTEAESANSSDDMD